MVRRLALTLAACTAIGLGVSACANDAAPSNPNAGGGATGATTTVKIMVGGLNKQIYLPAMLGKQLGFYTEQGLDVQLSDEPAGVDAENNMLAGAVDGVVGFYDHNIDLQSKGKSTESIVQFSQAPGEVELVRTDLVGTIKSAADFKGRKLGVTGLGSSTNFLTKYLAVHAGVPVDQITSVAVQAGPTFIAALQHKQIDAGMTTEPTITTAVTQGLASVLIDMRTVEGARAALGGTYPAACLYMTTDWVNAHKDAAQKLANAYVKTLKWIGSHTGGEIADKMPADYYTGIGKDAYAKALDAGKAMFTKDGVMPSDGPQTVLNVLSAFDTTVKGKTVDLSKTYTTEFVSKATS
ncbi:MAG: sulfonate transport system substrate-binding protein [Mycobacterium sp.]|nr:sulfonate transport system substrate-binding protein [Mycobacterium sp.]